MSSTWGLFISSWLREWITFLCVNIQFFTLYIRLDGDWMQDYHVMYLWLFQLLPSSQSHIKEFALLVIQARDFITGNWLPNFGFSILQLPQWDTRFGDRHRYAYNIWHSQLKNYGLHYQCHANLHDSLKLMLLSVLKNFI